ncbi:MAG: type II toxin-antitoxin system RelE/ParE family toxin [Fidelibacterota bacterium]
MTHKIKVLQSAKADIYNIYRYIARNDTPEIAADIIKNIKEQIKVLSGFPNIGHYTLEMEYFGNFDYREIHYQVLHIIYSIEKTDIFIHAVLDNRRNIMDLLQEKLLRDYIADLESYTFKRL